MCSRAGDVSVARLTTANIESWVSDLTSGGLSASRTRQAYLVLKGILDTAVKSRNLAVSPARGVVLPRAPQSRRRFLTMAQLEALAEAAGSQRLLIRVLGYCGLRWGEAAALTVANTDLRRSRLLVNKSGDDLVFPAPRGGYLRNSNFRRNCFDQAAHEVGLDGLVPHELRHTAASLAIRAGANVKVVQSMMGHASATMTWDLYGHLYDDDLDSVAERLDSVHAEFQRKSCGQSADSSRDEDKTGGVAGP
jgi:integrase